MAVFYSPDQCDQIVGLFVSILGHLQLVKLAQSITYETFLMNKP